MAVNLRRDLGRPLTYDEMDDNFANLDSASSSTSGLADIEAFVDSAYVNARVDHPDNLSAFVNDVGYISTADDIDATTMGGIGKDSSYYLDYTHHTNTPTIPVDNSELTNGAGYLDSVGVQDYINSIGGLPGGGGGTSLDSASLSQFSIGVLGDVNVTSPQLDDFLQWNGSQWVNIPFHVDASLEFHGVIDVVNDPAPLAPSNGDMYVNTQPGTVGSSWTGIAGNTATEGSQVIWSLDDSRWYLVGSSSGSGGGGITQVTGGTGISVDNSSPAYPSVSIDRSTTDTWYPDASTTVNTTANQTIGGIKTFSDTIQGSISGSAASAGTASSATIAEQVRHALTLNGTAYDGSASKSLTFATSDTVTRIRAGTSSYLTGSITLQGSGGTTLSQSGTTITISSTSSGSGTPGTPGVDGKGWTGGSYNAGTGKVTFTSTDGLGFATGDLRGAQGAPGVGTVGPEGPEGPGGKGWTGGSYSSSTGKVTFTSADGLGFSTDDLRAPGGGASTDTLQDVTTRGATTTLNLTANTYFTQGDSWTVGKSGGARLFCSNGTMALKNTSGTNICQFSSAGTVTATADVVAYSDERLKSNIETLDGSKVYQMRGVSFTKGGKESSGVIAQEIQKVAPELVHDDGEYLGVAYGNLVGYLIEAVKTLEGRVKELEELK